MEKRLVKTNKYRLYNEDCLKILPSIKTKVQLILVDPPYGTTPLEWDNILSFKKLWKMYNNILAENGCICIFGQEPFSTLLRYSNLEQYKYDWYWIKESFTNVFQVKRRPGKLVETISVFYSNQCKYYPIKRKHEGKLVTNKIGKTARFADTQGSSTKPLEYHDDGTRFPSQVLQFNRENRHAGVHPTQKPVPLLEYLIKTYTDKDDIVLDNCMGSGSTGVACMNTQRRFIGIEKEKNYFDIAYKRIDKSFNTLHNITWKK